MSDETKEAPAATYGDPLQGILKNQKKFVERWVDFDKLSEKEVQKWALEYIGHSIEELVELRRCLPRRKNWKKDIDARLDWNKIRDEYADVLHFVINIGLVFGIHDSKAFAEVYDKKHLVNLERQRNGY